MVVEKSNGEVFKQVGVMGFRDDDGEVIRTEPIYIKMSSSEVNPKTHMTKVEEKDSEDIAKILAEKFGEYVKGCRRAGIKF